MADPGTRPCLPPRPPSCKSGAGAPVDLTSVRCARPPSERLQDKGRTALLEATIDRFGLTAATIKRSAETPALHADSRASREPRYASREPAGVPRGAATHFPRPAAVQASQLPPLDRGSGTMIRIRVGNGRQGVRWPGVVLRSRRDPRDRDGWQRQAVSCPTKYVRILRRMIGGRKLWSTQLVQDGCPPRTAWRMMRVHTLAPGWHRYARGRRSAVARDRITQERTASEPGRSLTGPPARIRGSGVR